MAAKKVLICGATGFIGRNTAERLSQRDDLEVIGTYYSSTPYKNGAIKFIKANLADARDVHRVTKGMDAIIHCAATTTGAQDIVSRPYIHVTNNAVMSHLLLRAAFDNAVGQFIFPSCSIMYPPHNERPVTEDDYTGEIEEKYFGAASMKVHVEQICKFFSRFEKTRHTVFRHSNVYGPYDEFSLDKSHFFSATITKAMQAKTGDTITVWGDGSEERDLLYVSDVVDFIETALDKQKTRYELVNIGLGQSFSIAEMVQKIIRASGKNLKIAYDTSKPTIKTKVALDYTKARQMFGWEPKVDIDTGIEKTLEWYREEYIHV